MSEFHFMPVDIYGIPIRPGFMFSQTLTQRDVNGDTLNINNGTIIFREITDHSFRHYYTIVEGAARDDEPFWNMWVVFNVSESLTIMGGRWRQFVNAMGLVAGDRLSFHREPPRIRILINRIGPAGGVGRGRGRGIEGQGGGQGRGEGGPGVGGQGVGGPGVGGQGEGGPGVGGQGEGDPGAGGQGVGDPGAGGQGVGDPGAGGQGVGGDGEGGGGEGGGGQGRGRGVDQLTAILGGVEGGVNEYLVLGAFLDGVDQLITENEVEVFFSPVQCKVSPELVDDLRCSAVVSFCRHVPMNGDRNKTKCDRCQVGALDGQENGKKHIRLLEIREQKGEAEETLVNYVSDGRKGIAPCPVDAVLVGSRVGQIRADDCTCHEEESLHTTDRVMAVSFHKFGDYFQTEDMRDTGFAKGKYYSLNVPLDDGVSLQVDFKANLVLVARRENRLRGISESARRIGAGNVLIMAADAIKEEDCQRFINEKINYFGRGEQKTSVILSLESFLNKSPAEFQKTKIMARLTYTLNEIEGPFEVSQDEIDCAAVTVQLPGGECVPFLFRIKQLVASGKPDGEFLVPFYIGSSFLDPKGRGDSSGYVNAVALPAGEVLLTLWRSAALQRRTLRFDI